MSLRFAEPWPLWAGFLAALVLIAVVVLLYRRLGRAADRRSRLLFLGLRLAAALFLLALLLEPVLHRDRLRTESLSVVVLLDRSRSMSVPDSYRGRPRHQVAADFLTRPETGLLPMLEDEFRIVPLAFDTAVRPAEADEMTGATQPRGNLTDLAAALAAAGESGPRSEIVAVVLLTDGADNGGGDPLQAARDLGLPVYAVGFGSSAETEEGRKDLALVSVEAPETAFAENTVVAEASVRSTGYPLSDPGNRRVRVELSRDGEEVAAEWVEFTEDGIPVRVPLRFVPPGKGAHTYRVKVTVRGDEATPDNNSRTFTVNVLDRRASVLFFDAVMRWEAKFLRDFLARDPAVDLTSVLHSGQGRLLVYGDPHGADLGSGLPKTEEGFGKFDVIVLGDVPAEDVGGPGMELLRKRVEAGGGLLTLGGYRAYGAGGYTGTPVEEALPVFLGGGGGQKEEEVTVSETPEGRVHPALSGLSRWFSGGDRPVLRGLSLVQREKPGAQVLLTGDGGEIVLAAHRYGEGRVVSFTGDTSWVWYRDPRFGGEEGLYRRFWGQILRWLLEKEPEVTQTGDPVVLFTDRPRYRIGETVRIRARVRDEEGNPVTDATLTASLTGPDGESPLTMAPLRRVPGHYEVRIRAAVPGSYKAGAKAVRGATSLGAAEALFEVEESSVEMDEIDLDDALLAGVARLTGGRYYYSPPTAEEVARDIRGSLVGMVEEEELKLSNTPLFFLLFVALMGSEWYLRRRRNLL